MKICIVSVPLEFPLANYCIAAQVAATPETRDVEIELLNLNTTRLHDYGCKNAEIWRYIARIEESKPDIVAFSVYLWNHLNIRELISITAQLYPKINIIVGGPEIATTEAAKPWLETGEVSAAVRGEGEITMVEIVQRLHATKNLSGIAGCSWWDGKTIIHESPRAPVKDLSELASPYLTGWVPDDLFRCQTANGKGVFPRAFVETYRGCYMQCSYCQWGNGTTARFEFPQDRVRGEISWIISRKVDRLWIVDAMFGYKKQLAKDILRHIIEEKRRYGAQTTILCYHNQDFFDPELFDLYREANVLVEVDLQSTNEEVLTRVGRAKWYTDSFDRHLDAFRKQQVPTTGAADLIIGLPRDNYSSFADSVDFLLHRKMHINLYQTSIIPDTPMSRSIEEDGIVYSRITPRAVLKNKSFSVEEMVMARLIGHGVDFFGRYPKTAELLWRTGYTRPVDLCARIGDLIWTRHGIMYGESHTYDAVLAAEQTLVEGLLDDLCMETWLRPIAHDLFRLEAISSTLSRPARNAIPHPALTPGLAEIAPDWSWLDSRLRYRREAVKEVRLEYRINRALNLWDKVGEMPSEDIWRGVEKRPAVALVYLFAPGVSHYKIVDPELTYNLLLRLSGYFTVAECLDNFLSNWRQQNLTPLWDELLALTRIGLIDIGLPNLVGVSSAGIEAKANGAHLLRVEQEKNAVN
jgi:radical SAM superfamily enzyme YgiQ (UPF0313 family)